MRYRLLFLLLPLTLLFASCTGEDEGMRYAIGFQTSDSSALRASETDADNMSDFRVWSVWTRDASEQVYMDGIQVARADNQSPWTYSPVFYWPTEGKLDFYAHSPASSTGLLDFDFGTNTLRYDVTTDLARQEDFVIASALNPAKNAAVRFDFDHILSQVKFEVDDVTITVQKIEVKSLYRQGTYSSGVWTPSGTPTTTYTAIESEYLMVLPQATNLASVVITYDINGGAQNVSKEITFTSGFVFEPGKKYTVYLVVE